MPMQGFEPRQSPIMWGKQGFVSDTRDVNCAKAQRQWSTKSRRDPSRRLGMAAETLLLRHGKHLVGSPLPAWPTRLSSRRHARTINAELADE